MNLLVIRKGARERERERETHGVWKYDFLLLWWKKSNRGTYGWLWFYDITRLHNARFYKNFIQSFIYLHINNALLLLIFDFKRCIYLFIYLKRDKNRGHKKKR